MKKNLIVVGDSFCASNDGWPQQLADTLGLNLICYGRGGESWWAVRKFLATLTADQINATQTIVFVHTNAERIPTDNSKLVTFDYQNPNLKDQEELAVHLYYKHVFNPEFMFWAQQQWFAEIEQQWKNKQVLHLHSFPWTTQHKFSATTVLPSLCALSLNELGAETFSLINDVRPNHLNRYNNGILAHQLSEIIASNTVGTVTLKVEEFQQATTRWLTWN